MEAEGSRVAAAAWDAVGSVVADDLVVGPTVPEPVAKRAIDAVAAHFDGSAEEARRRAAQCADAFALPPPVPTLRSRWRPARAERWLALVYLCTQRAAGSLWRSPRWVACPGHPRRLRPLPDTPRSQRQGGRLSEAVTRGRTTLLNSVRRTRFREVLWHNLERKRWRGAPLGARFHLRDLAGQDLVDVESTTAGKLVRVSREGT